jgi:hypothetical protein
MLLLKSKWAIRFTISLYQDILQDKTLECVSMLTKVKPSFCLWKQGLENVWQRVIFSSSLQTDTIPKKSIFPNQISSVLFCTYITNRMQSCSNTRGQRSLGYVLTLKKKVPKQIWKSWIKNTQIKVSISFKVFFCVFDNDIEKKKTYVYIKWFVQ